ncbi:ribosomal protein L15 [Microstroma glucosiphilum]|uniref:Ribosomal protein L15 n=1 Tax=Pseudomicrostroma glucosiphilum TaxID=1684307 RepID=A0A316UDL9_9BASI|nr:ribosomal protein L15 [Pseudomicrostroma glucosiphilum]PWN22988.1 ribosomal protein L15 [Pseudomicrostroma glucosiphilum]
MTIAQPTRVARTIIRPAFQSPALRAPTSSPADSRSYASAAPSSYSIGSLSPAQPKKTMKRVGRGPSSGRGGTATRGHKGQRARAGNGKPTPGFEGGQTPIMRRYPKRGFVNAFAHRTVPLNIERLQDWIDQGRIDPSKPITAKELYETRCVHSLGDGGVKLLGEGSKTLRQPLTLIVSRASATAIRAVEAAGGSITCKFYTPLTLRALVKPEKWLLQGKMPPNEPLPVGKRDLLYYSDIRNRGYLAKLHLTGTLALI